jgi:hypothetical protein
VKFACAGPIPERKGDNEHVREEGSMDKDFCKQCGRVVDEGSQHDWVSHQPKRLQPILKELGFNAALTAKQRAVLIARLSQ